jgi:hypothetical protein
LLLASALLLASPFPLDPALLDPPLLLMGYLPGEKPARHGGIVMI